MNGHIIALHWVFYEVGICIRIWCDNDTSVGRSLFHAYMVFAESTSEG